MKIRRLFLSLLVLALALPVAIPALADAPVIADIEYEGGGLVLVEFASAVSYRSPQITVKSGATAYAATITDRTDAYLLFLVEDIEAGKTYSFTLTGIRAGKTGAFGSVTGKFKTPATARPIIAFSQYDQGLVHVVFASDVSYKNLKVTLTANGRSYTAAVTERGSDHLTFKPRNVPGGVNYTYTISGIRAGNSGNYTSVKGKIRVPRVTEPVISEIRYKNTFVTLKFASPIQIRNLKLSVYSPSGKCKNAAFTAFTGSELTFRVPEAKKNYLYSFTITGLRLKNVGNYTSVSGSFWSING